MSTARFIVGDVFDGLASLEDNSVDLVMSSTPFLALRSYLPADHPDKGKEIGSEATPGEFLDVLLDVVVECRRVLAPHGSLVFELGDTFAGSGGAGGDYNPGGWRHGQGQFDGSSRRERASEHKYAGEWANPGYGDGFKGGNPGGRGWPLDKSLACIPALFEASLSYGRNLLTGRKIEPWRVRNFVAWCRPNPPVGALGDKFRPATSYLTVACTGRDRYFDLDAVREPHKPHTLKYDGGTRPHYGERGGQGTVTEMEPGAKSNPGGAPPLDWWEIPTAPYRGAHYATFPPELCVRPVKSMCPERVCRVCGGPSRRILEPHYVKGHGGTTGKRRNLDEPDGRTNGTGMTGKPVMDVAHTTLGWSDCGHNDWRAGRALDPFAGSGTTLLVATGHGRDAIGIDLDERNADLAVERLGMFLTVEELAVRDTG